MQTPLPVQDSAPPARARERVAPPAKTAGPDPKKADKSQFARALDERRRAAPRSDEAAHAAAAGQSQPAESDRQSAQTNPADAQDVRHDASTEDAAVRTSEATSDSPDVNAARAETGAAESGAASGEQASPSSRPNQTAPFATTQAPAGDSQRSTTGAAGSTSDPALSKVPAAAPAQGAAAAQGTAPTTGTSSAHAGTAQQGVAGWEPAEAQSGGRDAEGSMNGSDSGTPRHAAAGRAMQVQAAIHLENATGQAPSPDLSVVKPALVAAAAPNLTSPAADASNPTEPRQDVLSSQVLRGLNAMVNQRGGVLNMRLEPPELGQLRVQMTIARGVVTAQFHASTQQAQALLDQSMASLRSALENHGLTVDRLTVTTSAPNQHADVRDGQSDEQAPHQQHGDAGQGRSRGRRDDPADQAERFASRLAGERAEFDTFEPPAAARSDAA